MNIGTYSFEEYLKKVEAFHGYAAPGVLIGGRMVEMAKSRLPPDILFEAICETRSCVPDAIQLLTPCTTGNGRLHVCDYGRYALTLYDKRQGDGWRVYLDPSKLEKWPEIKGWFLKLVAKKEQDQAALRAQIKGAKGQIFGLQQVQIRPHLLGKAKKGPVAICPSCKEAYPKNDGELCKPCQGDSPYISIVGSTTTSGRQS
jgi:formylmethanofuran dehydrogenase subunit E